MTRKRWTALLAAAMLLMLLPLGVLADYASPIVGKAYEETVFSAPDVECVSAATSGSVPSGISVKVVGTGLGNKVVLYGTPTAEGTYSFSVTTQMTGSPERVDTVSLTVLPCASTPSVSVSVSSSGTVSLGSSLTFTPTVSGANGTLSYQWFRQDSSGTRQIIGTSSSLVFSPGSVVSGAVMYLEVTNTLNGTSVTQTASATYSVTAAAASTPTATASATPTAKPTPTATPKISESPISGDKEGEIYNCNVSVNVRSGPSTDYEVIGKAKLGAKYPALATSGKWVKIQYTSTQVGYVHSSYFTLEPVVQTTPTPTLSPTPSPSPTPTAEPSASPSPEPVNSPDATLVPGAAGTGLSTAAPTAIPAVSAAASSAGGGLMLYVMIGVLGALVVVSFITLIVLLLKQWHLRREDEEEPDGFDPDPYDEDGDGYDEEEEYDEDDEEDEDDEDDLPDLGFRKR